MEKDDKYIEEKVRDIIRDAEIRYRGKGVENILVKMLEKNYEKRLNFVELDDYISNILFHEQKVKKEKN
jgi:hypothetical protein